MKFETAHKVFRAILGAGLFVFVIHVVSNGVPFHWSMIVVPGFLVGASTETALAFFEIFRRK